jgi:hypothetical protein
MSAKRLSRLDEDDSVGDREREEPSTPIREASAVTDKRKTEGTAGGGEELEDDAESDIGADIQYDGRVGQGGKPGLEGATTTKDEETDAEFGSTTDGRDGRHVVRPVKSQGTSMRAKGTQQGTDGDGRMMPTRGEHEEDNGDEFWHDAREDGLETTAYGKAKDGAKMEPEGDGKSHVGEEEVGNRHVRFGCDAIRTWIGRPRRDHDMNEEKDREGGEPSTPIRGTSTVTTQRKTEETTGGGKNLEARADEVTGAGIRYETTGERGPRWQAGVGRGYGYDKRRA